MVAMKTFVWILACGAYLQMVQGEVLLLNVTLDALKDLAPCIVPCVADNFLAVTDMVKRDCVPEVKMRIDEISQTIDPGAALDNQQPICRVVNSFADCISRTLLRFCGNDVKQDFERSRLYASNFLDCEKKDDTRLNLLRCLLHDEAKVLVECGKEINSSVVNALNNDMSMINIYNTLLKDPSGTLRTIMDQFLTCLDERLGRSAVISCSRSVLDISAKESKAVLDFFLRPPSTSMDGIPCFSRPGFYSKLSTCVTPYLQPLDRVPEDDISAVIRTVLEKDGFLEKAINCAKEAMLEESACQDEGWSMVTLQRVTQPFLDYLNKEPEIGHCNCEYEDYPMGECMSDPNDRDDKGKEDMDKETQTEDEKKQNGKNGSAASARSWFGGLGLVYASVIVFFCRHSS